MSNPLRDSLAAAFLCILVPMAAEAQRGQVTLPEGPGREVVQASCAACHGLNQITGAAGYTQEGWRDLISSMVALPGPPGGRRRRSIWPRIFPRSRAGGPRWCRAT